MIQTTMIDLKAALSSGNLEAKELIAFNCKQELFIQDRKSGKEIFSAYYGANNACEDVCTLLNIEMQVV